jgi:hypothetical protein
VVRRHDPKPTPEEAEVLARREQHIQLLSEQQSDIAEAARQEAARQQREFGEGNQG